METHTHTLNFQRDETTGSLYIRDNTIKTGRFTIRPTSSLLNVPEEEILTYQYNIWLTVKNILTQSVFAPDLKWENEAGSEYSNDTILQFRTASNINDQYEPYIVREELPRRPLSYFTWASYAHFLYSYITINYREMFIGVRANRFKPSNTTEIPNFFVSYDYAASYNDETFPSLVNKLKETDEYNTQQLCSLFPRIPVEDIQKIIPWYSVVMIEDSTNTNFVDWFVENFTRILDPKLETDNVFNTTYNTITHLYETGVLDTYNLDAAMLLFSTQQELESLSQIDDLLQQTAGMPLQWKIELLREKH